MVPMIIMERGEVVLPMLPMALSKNPGRGINSSCLANPRKQAIIPGFNRMFLHLLLKSDWVKRDNPALHIIIRFGIIKNEA